VAPVCEVHDAKHNEAHGAMKKEHHVCARRRVGEPAVSCERQCLTCMGAAEIREAAVSCAWGCGSRVRLFEVDINMHPQYALMHENDD
jgi:hypothetical protein